MGGDSDACRPALEWDGLLDDVCHVGGDDGCHDDPFGSAHGADIHEDQSSAGGELQPVWGTAVFYLGYLLIWTLFSAVATVTQGALHAATLLSPMMETTSPVLGGVILIAAGVFQFTPLKYACLSHCRTPLGYFMTEWREGRWGALVMGIRHGAYCVGCCWLMMALLFVAGVMNLFWIAVIAAYVLLEKVLPDGQKVSWGYWRTDDGLGHLDDCRCPGLKTREMREEIGTYVLSLFRMVVILLPNERKVNYVKL